MDNLAIIQKLKNANIIDDENSLKEYEQHKPLSIFWELRSVLYFGIMLLSSGLGMLIYQNIDSFGHALLIGFISLICLASFGLAFKHRKAFSRDEIITSNLDEFALLLACLTFLTLEGYLQYQFNVFGTKYGFAALLPTILFFFCAYFFDHRGVLTMAITALASWVGIKIAFRALLQSESFNELNLVYSAIILGIILVIIAWLSIYYNFKKHFSFTYLFMGGNLASIASLTALVQYDTKPLYVFIIIALAVYFVYMSLQVNSFLFMLLGIIYTYLAFTYSMFHYLPDISATFYFFYFVISSIGVVILFIKLPKLLKQKSQHESL